MWSQRHFVLTPIGGFSSSFIAFYLSALHHVCVFFLLLNVEFRLVTVFPVYRVIFTSTLNLHFQNIAILTLLGVVILKKRNKAVSLNGEAKLALLFCYQTRGKSVFTSPLPSMYQSCIFISHSWLHVTLELQPIYFTPGALRSSFRGPIKLCAAKQMWKVIFTGTAAAAAVLVFQPPDSLLWISSILTHLCVFISRLWDHRRWDHRTSDGNQRRRAREAPRQGRTERTFR